jgi:hypothetical protein
MAILPLHSVKRKEEAYKPPLCGRACGEMVYRLAEAVGASLLINSKEACRFGTVSGFQFP